MSVERYRISRDYRGVIHLQILNTTGITAVALAEQLRTEPLLDSTPDDPRTILVFEVGTHTLTDFLAGALFGRFPVIAKEAPTYDRPCCAVICSSDPRYPDGSYIDDLATCLRGKHHPADPVSDILSAARERWNGSVAA